MILTLVIRPYEPDPPEDEVDDDDAVPDIDEDVVGSEIGGVVDAERTEYSHDAVKKPGHEPEEDKPEEIEDNRDKTGSSIINQWFQLQSVISLYLSQKCFLAP